jgi:polyisoprenoid-binding protein YceI
MLNEAGERPMMRGAEQRVKTAGKSSYRSLVAADVESGIDARHARARVGTISRWFAASLTVFALAACEDPSKGAAKAVTAEATPSAAEAKLSAANAVKYTFDQTTSKVEWTGSKVTGKHEGGFKSFRGTVSLVDQTLEQSSVTVDIDTDSLFADAEKLSGHLRSADFFDVAKFPKASFASTAVKKGGEKGASHTVTGNLTLHGVTKSISFPATIKINAGGVDVDAEFAINRKDFGLVYPGKPDDLIRDDVVIRLTIRSRKQP